MMPLSARKGSWLVSEEAEQLLLTARRQPQIIDLIVCLLLTVFCLWYFSRFSPLVAACVMAVGGMCLWVWLRVVPRLKSDQNRIVLCLCVLWPIIPVPGTAIFGRQMSTSYIRAELRRLVIARADFLCEYCLLHEDDMLFSGEVDHMVSEKHGGLTQKDSDLGSLAVQTSTLTRFYSPHRDLWHQLFTWTSRTAWSLCR